MRRMVKAPLHIVRRASKPKPLKAPSVDAMTPGDILMRLSIISPDTYRAVIAIAREKYKALWPFPYDILPLRTGTER